MAASAGEAHTLAVSDGGAVYAWGHNANSQLGVVLKPGAPKTEGANQLVPVPVPGLARERIACVSAGQCHSLAVSDVGALFAWGSGAYGQLGLDGVGVASKAAFDAGAGALADPGHDADVAEPRPVPLRAGCLVRAVDVAAGAEHSAVLLSDGRVLTCGRNVNGQLGHGDDASSRPRFELSAVGGDVGARKAWSLATGSRSFFSAVLVREAAAAAGKEEVAAAAAVEDVALDLVDLVADEPSAVTLQLNGVRFEEQTL